MTNQDEPAYMLAARSNTRDGVPSSGYIVERLREGQAVTNDRGQLGIITATHYSRGKVKILESCGVMWIGRPYAVREQADSLTPITLERRL